MSKKVTEESEKKDEKIVTRYDRKVQKRKEGKNNRYYNQCSDHSGCGSLDRILPHPYLDGSE